MLTMHKFVSTLLLVVATGYAPSAFAAGFPAPSLPGVAVVPVAAVLAAPVADIPAHVATEWFKLLVQLVKRAPGFTPPVAARAFGYTGVTLYEAVVTGMPGYQSLHGQLSAMPAMPAPPANMQLDRPAVANAALATIALIFFPQSPTHRCA